MTNVDDLFGRIAAHVNGASSDLSPMLSAARAADAEAALGFEIHPLLRRLYQRIANGGFGPGYKLLELGGVSC